MYNIWKLQKTNLLSGRLEINLKWNRNKKI